MNITTIKLEKETKKRIDKLKEHKRETYEDVLRKILYILNTVKVEPEKAQKILNKIDKVKKPKKKEQSKQ